MIEWIMKSRNTKKPKNSCFNYILLLNLVSSAVWIIGRNINVYGNALLGAIFEILWLPLIAGIVLVPAAALYCWIRDGLKASSKFLYLLIWSLLSMFILYILTIN